MPTLNWIGKEKIVNHDKDVPFRLLKKTGLSFGKSENLIVEGDNLEALKALMPFYYGRVKCIYIDPPYNTGNEKWVYNDRVNSPKIKEWLGKVVGAEGEDLTRHDKWLCMMYPRLKMLKDLLSDNGMIFVSIDDNEGHVLKMLMDEVFGEDKFITNFIWKKKSTSTNVEGVQISSLTDYVLTYGKTKHAKIKARMRPKETRNYPLRDKLGKYRLTIIEKKHAGTYERESMRFPILGVYPREGKRWQIGKVTAEELEKKRRFIIDNGVVKLKIYDFEDKDTFSAQPNLLDEHGTTDSAQKMLTGIFGKPEIFDNPKPIELIKHLISVTCDKNDIILDSFAGSGTTAHAVLELNKEDGGNRKFILVEMEKDICRKITSERVRRVAKGYSYKKAKGETVKVQGLGGGFEYAELGTSLFNADGAINEKVSFEEMARYVYFTETHTNLEKKAVKGNYLGKTQDTHYFLYFDGIGKNVLDKKSLKEIKSQKGKKVIYADKCLLDEDILDKQQIIFKQIPYSVKVY